jgi:threonine dehydrogenase-like Zn-dependent dehydrogenase
MSTPAYSRAARIRSPRELRVEDRDVQDPTGDQIRVRLEGCGVCASNLPVWEGRPWFSYPLDCGSPGHEGWGTVDALGPLAHGFAVGERVAILSQHAYAGHDCASVESVVRLPAELNSQPFPGEALACAMNIFRRSQVEAGQSVAIVGIGFLGAILCALSVRAGARVVALSRRPFALQLAERFGASATVGLEDARQAYSEARRLSGGDGYERVIECVGAQTSLDLASELTGTRSRLVIAGYHQDGQRHVDLQQWNWRGLDVINAHERDTREYRCGMQEAMELAVAGELDLAALFTHQFPLDDTAAAFQMLSERPDGFLKALIICQ